MSHPARGPRSGIDGQANAAGGRHAEMCQARTIWKTLNKSFDKLRTNGKRLISFVVSLSNHTANQRVQRFHGKLST
jgi:hypothetical protein